MQNIVAGADLVIIGARRRHGDFGLQLGRVGHTLLHHAHCPVAVVPQSAATKAGARAIAVAVGDS